MREILKGEDELYGLLGQNMGVQIVPQTMYPFFG
jgi:hypothetical protein